MIEEVSRPRLEGRAEFQPHQGAAVRPGGFRSAVLVADTRADPASTKAAVEYLRLLGLPVAGARVDENTARSVERAVSEGHGLILLSTDLPVSLVAGLLARTNTTLGLLPLGTANGLTSTRRLPSRLKAACEVICGGVVEEVNLALAGGHHFFNVASVGPTPGFAWAPSPQARSATYGPFAAALAFPDGDHEPVAIDGLSRIIVRNGRNPGGAALDVYATEAGTETGEFVGNERVHHWPTSRVLLATDPPLPLDLDGEPTTQTPKAFSTAPCALKILVPAKAPELPVSSTPGPTLRP